MCFSSDKRITCREKSPPPNEGSPHTYSLNSMDRRGSSERTRKRRCQRSPCCVCVPPVQSTSARHGDRSLSPRSPEAPDASCEDGGVPPGVHRHWELRAREARHGANLPIPTSSSQQALALGAAHSCASQLFSPRGAKGCCPRDGVDPRGVFFELPPRPSTARARASRVVATSTSDGARRADVATPSLRLTPSLPCPAPSS